MKKILACLVLASMSMNVFASRGRARTMVERMEKEARTGRITPRSQIESAQRRFESEAFRALRNREGMDSITLSRAIFREYLKQNKKTPENMEAIQELMESITSRGDVVIAEQLSTANLLAESVVMGSKGKFTLEPRDVLEINRNWTAREKDQLADVLTEARKIMEENPSLSPDLAFEQALGNRGLLEQFRRRCK